MDIFDGNSGDDEEETAWDTPALNENGVKPPRKTKFSKPPHPYLRRVLETGAYSSFATTIPDRSGYLYSQDFQHISRELPMAKSVAYAEIKKLFLRQYAIVEPEESGLSDSLLTEIPDGCASLCQLREYPHLYLILDKHCKSHQLQVEKYLREQTLLSFAFCGYQNKATNDYDPVCVIFATQNISIVMDIMPGVGHLEPHRVLFLVRSIMENDSVIKVVNNFKEVNRRINTQITVHAKNIYDVSKAEWAVDGCGYGEYYTIRQFQKEHAKRSVCFGTFPDDEFFARDLLCKPECGNVRYMDREELFLLLKQVIFLQLIRRIQLERLMSQAIQETTEAMIKLYNYAEVSETKDSWLEVVLQDKDVQKAPVEFLGDSWKEQESLHSSDESESDEVTAESEDEDVQLMGCKIGRAQPAGWGLA